MLESPASLYLYLKIYSLILQFCGEKVTLKSDMSQSDSPHLSAHELAWNKAAI